MGGLLLLRHDSDLEDFVFPLPVIALCSDLLSLKMLETQTEFLVVSKHSHPGIQLFSRLKRPDQLRAQQASCVSRDSVAAITTPHGLDGLGIESQ